ncbi:DUF5133 domain-containing protein [Streptomyces sp. NPDC048508]|uniref:DUF5133 domain-containing protein n=1 Tax=Streptomyces sp. NPDC048508 TaxID=3365561 RepID=UPI003718F5A7
MLVPDPKVVRRLLTRYAALKIAYAEKETLETARRLEDVTYTLCAMTGKTGVHDAVFAADAMLAAGGNGRETDKGACALVAGGGPAAVATNGVTTVPAPMARTHTEAGALTGLRTAVPGPRG